MATNLTAPLSITTPWPFLWAKVPLPYPVTLTVGDTASIRVDVNGITTTWVWNVTKTGTYNAALAVPGVAGTIYVEDGVLFEEKA